MCDLDGAYWTLAAGEQEERRAALGHLDGYDDLDEVLNDIFDNSLAPPPRLTPY